MTNQDFYLKVIGDYYPSNEFHFIQSSMDRYSELIINGKKTGIFKSNKWLPMEYVMTNSFPRSKEEILKLIKVI